MDSGDAARHSGCNWNLDFFQLAGAVADAVSGDADSFEHREVEICHGRLAAQADVAARGEGSAATASQADRQVVVTIRVAIADPCAIDNHAVITHRALAFPHGSQFFEAIGKLASVEPID